MIMCALTCHNAHVNRISQLESDLSSQQERVGQLQAQKEKALSDLKAIRKLNRTMEKLVTNCMQHCSHITVLYTFQENQ